MKKTESLIERKLKNPQYRKRFEKNYALFQLEVQALNELERKAGLPKTKIT